MNYLTSFYLNEGVGAEGRLFLGLECACSLWCCGHGGIRFLLIIQRIFHYDQALSPGAVLLQFYNIAAFQPKGNNQAIAVLPVLDK